MLYNTVAVNLGSGMSVGIISAMQASFVMAQKRQNGSINLVLNHPSAVSGLRQKSHGPGYKGTVYHRSANAIIMLQLSLSLILQNCYGMRMTIVPGILSTVL